MGKKFNEKSNDLLSNKKIEIHANKLDKYFLFTEIGS